MTARSRTRRLAPAAALAAALITVVGASPAAAASDHLRYDGASLNMARVPAQVVTIDALSSTEASSATYLVGSRVVGQDTDLAPDGDRWLASARVDLSGLHGLTQLTVRFQTGKSSRRVWKFFRAIPPPPASNPTPGAPPSSVVPLPDTSRTGVPAGTTLTPSGALSIWRAGTVVDGLDVQGCVNVRASDVVIRNTRIRCTRPTGGVAVLVGGGAKNLVLEGVEVDGLGTSQVCVGWGDYTLRRVDLHGCADGARFGHRVLIEDSWVHDLARIGTLHSDALQTTSASDVTIRRSTLDARSPEGDFTNAALMLGSETGSRLVTRVTVEGNHLDGGNYALNVRGDINASAVVVRGNSFGDATRFGPALVPVRVPLGGGNVYSATGEPVPVVAP